MVPETDSGSFYDWCAGMPLCNLWFWVVAAAAAVLRLWDLVGAAVVYGNTELGLGVVVCGEVGAAMGERDVLAALLNLRGNTYKSFG